MQIHFRRLRLPRSRGLRLIAGILGSILGAYVAIVLLAYVSADRLLFQPPPASYGRDEVPFQRIPVGRGDSIAVVYLPSDHPALTILFSHGNAEDLGQVYPFLEQLHGWGFSVIAYDYRGYGQSTGGPAGTRKAGEDAEAVYRWALDSLRIPPERLVLHGRSLGSGPSLALAVHHGAAGLVLESAFTSAYRVLTRVDLLPFDRFPNLRLIRQVRCPILVIHGTADGVVPFAHGQALFAAAPGPKQSLWVQGADHNDVQQVAGDAYLKALTRLATLVELAPTEPLR